MNDMALNALFEVSKKEEPNLSTEILKTIYEIEKVNQFEQNRNVLSAIQSLLENEIKGV